MEQSGTLGKVDIARRSHKRFVLELVLDSGDTEGRTVGMVEGWVSAFAELHREDARLVMLKERQNRFGAERINVDFETRTTSSALFRAGR